MTILIIAIATLTSALYIFKLGVRIGTRQAELFIGQNFFEQLKFLKSIADNLLIKRADHAKLRIHLGEYVVDCKSSMETAQFSMSLKEVLGWLTPAEELCRSNPVD